MTKKLLEQLKAGFKRTIRCNKYRSQMTVQSNNNNLNYLIDPTFTKAADCLFCYLKELKKIKLKKIIEIFFTLLQTKRRNKRFQCFNQWKNFL